MLVVRGVCWCSEYASILDMWIGNCTRWYIVDVFNCECEMQVCMKMCNVHKWMCECKWPKEECVDEETSMFAKLTHVFVQSIVWECECFNYCANMSCQCVKKSMKSIQIGIGSLFSSLSFEDPTMSGEYASQLCHHDCHLPLVTQVTETFGTSSSIFRSYVLDSYSIFLMCNVMWQSCSK